MPERGLHGGATSTSSAATINGDVDGAVVEPKGDGGAPPPLDGASPPGDSGVTRDSEARDSASTIDAPPSSDAGISKTSCPDSGRCKVLAVGDSITAGHGTVSLGGYRAPMFHYTLQDQKPLDYVGSQQDGPETVDNVPFPRAHEGYPGWKIGTPTSAGIFGVVPGAIRTYQPHIALLMIGTNDMAQRYELSTAPARLGALLDAMLEADADLLIVVGTIPPSSDEGMDAEIRKYNAAIPAVVKARADQGKNVLLVDHYAAFVANPNWRTEYLADLVHPNEAGGSKMADVWYAVVKDLLH